MKTRLSDMSIEAAAAYRAGFAEAQARAVRVAHLRAAVEPVNDPVGSLGAIGAARAARDIEVFVAALTPGGP